MTKRKGLIFALFLIAYMFCFGFAAMAAPEYDLAVNFGIGNTAKPGKNLRVQTTVTGEFGEDFEGVIRIAPTSDYAGNVRFDFPVKGTAEGVIRTDVYVPLLPDSNSMRVSLLDTEKEHEYASVWQDFNLYESEQLCLTGLFSDTPADFAFLQDATMRYGTLRLKEVAVDKKDIPDDVKGYDIFDLVIVSEYDLGRLTEEQYQALDRYVENGGILLLDGNNPEQNFGPFYDALIESPADFTADIVISNTADMDALKPGDEELVVSALDLNIRNGITVLQGDRFPAIYYVNKGLGRIVVTTFAISEINYYCEKNSYFAETFLTYVLGEDKIEELLAEDALGVSDFYYSIRNLVGTGSLRRLPSITLLGLVILVYVICVGPVLHGILRSLRLEHYYLNCAAGFALVCTGIIYLIGSGTRFTDTFFTYARIIDISGKEEKEDTYINVRSPYDEHYAVEFQGEYTIAPIPVRDAYEESRHPGRDKNTITIREEGLSLDIYPTESFENQIFFLEKRDEVTEEALVVDAGYVDTEDGIRIVGSAESRMKTTVEDAVLIMNGKAVLLGTLAPGDHRKLEEEEQLNFPLGDSFALARQITGSIDTEDAVMTGNTTGLLARERMRLLGFYFESQKQKEYDKPMVIGFVSEKEEDLPGFFGHTKAAEGITMVTSQTGISEYDNKKVYPLPAGAIRVVSGSYEPYTNVMKNDTGEPLVIEYDLGDLSTLQKIRMEKLSDCFREDESLLTPDFTGDILFYNHETGNFTRVEDKEEYTAEELKDYLSPSASIQVRFDPDFNRDISWEMALPIVFSVNAEAETPAMEGPGK